MVPVSELHIDFFIAAALQDREEKRRPAAFERLLGGAGDAQQDRLRGEDSATLERVLKVKLM